MGDRKVDQLLRSLHWRWPWLQQLHIAPASAVQVAHIALSWRDDLVLPVMTKGWTEGREASPTAHKSSKIPSTVNTMLLNPSLERTPENSRAILAGIGQQKRGLLLL